MKGLTPFARWGNWAIVTLLLVSLLIITAGAQIRYRRKSTVSGAGRLADNE
jgi:apolipoprotein N-acyltransferase